MVKAMCVIKTIRKITLKIQGQSHDQGQKLMATFEAYSSIDTLIYHGNRIILS